MFHTTGDKEEDPVQKLGESKFRDNDRRGRGQKNDSSSLQPRLRTYILLPGDPLLWMLSSETS